MPTPWLHWGGSCMGSWERSQPNWRLFGPGSITCTAWLASHIGETHSPGLTSTGALGASRERLNRLAG